MQLRDTSVLRVPAARSLDLVTTESKDEALVYDLTAHHIHHLNATATRVWRLCDGECTVSEIALAAGIAEDAVKLALRTLEDAQLLDGPLTATMRGTQSRRAFMKKAAIAGAVPAIVSVSAPMAASAASCQTRNCSQNTIGSSCGGRQVASCGICSGYSASNPGNGYICQ